MNTSALKQKNNLVHSYPSNSATFLSQLLHIRFAFEHYSTGVTAFSTVNNWKSVVKHRYSSTVLNK